MVTGVDLKGSSEHDNARYNVLSIKAHLLIVVAGGVAGKLASRSVDKRLYCD
jgi:hypothetical protein